MLTKNMDLALFPLNVVLFPGMVLPLHIFEDRYKAMVKDCMANDQTFGVVLARTKQAQSPQVDGLYEDDLYQVGTVARITAVENLRDGRMNLITVGQDRFMIKNIRASKDDYLIGSIDPYPMQADVGLKNTEKITAYLRTVVQRYIDRLSEASGEDLSHATLPSDAVGLAYLAGTALQGPLADKQQLLNADSFTRLMVDTFKILSREEKILSYMLEAYQVHQRVQKLPFVDYSLN